MRQIKVMVGAMDLLGMPLVRDVVSGKKASDPLYIAAVNRMVQMLSAFGLLFVGNCKINALATQAHIQPLEHRYLCSSALSGDNAELLSGWVQKAKDEQVLRQVYVEDKGGTGSIQPVRAKGKKPTFSPACIAAEEGRSAAYSGNRPAFLSKPALLPLQLGRAGNIVTNGHPNSRQWQQLCCTVCDRYFAESTTTIFHRSRRKASKK